ncbi:hypothetical protein C8K18_13113 [Paraburkholderia sp. GV068]|jgi:hypothetical protein|uniref:hypothetical protein n=1 Tax=unclassified Paraburkholderia TaxID=2615204 RepID=UPI000D3262FE|nr:MULTISPECIES: hypothetical protein [unclassified Paraburkholderia]PTQ91444.1 hypothetical protein C8K19_13016 [Paraburkholderia sp. GV072]PUA93636.1 hypothetical protein C8K18_13113 [Paraburkholderia sp. GV068]
MKRLIFTTSLLLAPLIVHAEISHDTFCFGSSGEKPVNFEMTTYFDSSTKLSWGFVKNQKSPRAIPLILAESTAQTLDKDVPDEVQTTWVEVLGKQVTGEYQMISQGAMVYSMVYISGKSGKKTAFGLKLGALTDNGRCDWQ